MRELHGVFGLFEFQLTASGSSPLSRLKRYGLLFDKLHLVISPVNGLPTVMNEGLSYVTNPKDRTVTGKIFIMDDLQEEYDYLHNRGVLGATAFLNQAEFKALGKKKVRGLPEPHYAYPLRTSYRTLSEIVTRQHAIYLDHLFGMETVPVFERGIHKTLKLDTHTVPNHSTLRIASSYLPVLRGNNSWDDILAFREEARDKLWNFRRFLQTLSSKKQTESETRDDIEWSLNEYRKAMKLHNLKAGNSFMEVYVLPAIELIEDIAKFNWAKIAKGALSVKKRQIDLMEAEMKAPGREVAYIYDAQKRFRRSQP